VAVYEGARPRTLGLPWTTRAPRPQRVAQAPTLDRRRVRGAVRAGRRTNRLGLVLGAIVVAFMLAFFSLAQQVQVSATGLDIGRLSLERQRLDDAAADALRSRAAELDLYVEAIVKAPQTDADVESFDAAIRTAARVGALAARTTIMPGRRYEQFDDLATFREFAARGKQALVIALPRLVRVKFAVRPR